MFGAIKGTVMVIAVTVMVTVKLIVDNGDEVTGTVNALKLSQG